MEQLLIKNFGPIKDLDIKLGDLTILLGPQASGKTLFLQILKLLIDKDHIVETLSRYNYITDKQADRILNYYFGDRLSSMWSKETEIKIDNERFAKNRLLNSSSDAKEKVFYIPAQRILSISDGRPKNFMEYDISSPYVLRNFSETLRLFFQNSIGDEKMFPLNNHLKGGMKKAFNDTIFHGGEVVIDEQSGQKKMRMKVGDSSLPFMTWSAGQKEFMPLLMAIYCLTGPPIKTINREQYEYIIIEEPEMGLHPKAIQSVIIQILEFINSGYKVIVSTHSAVLLEFAWAYNNIKNLPAEIRPTALRELFDISSNSDDINKIFEGVTDKRTKTYYFSHIGNGVKTFDISSLDVASDNMDESEWGGLSQFASRASDIVSKYMMKYEA